jgi:hypothetical protein
MLESYLKKVASMFAFLEMLKDRTYHWMNSWIPYFVMKVDYIDQETKEKENIYCVTDKIPWYDISFEDVKQGYLYIQYWSNKTKKCEELMLHTDYVKEACKMTSLENSWAFSEAGFISLLEDYMLDTVPMKMIDLVLNDQNIYEETKQLQKSLCLKKNITPRVFATFKYPNLLKKEDDITLTYVDEDIKDHIVMNDTWIVS